MHFIYHGAIYLLYMVIFSAFIRKLYLPLGRYELHICPATINIPI
jgi:hypothetical protein